MELDDNKFSKRIGHGGNVLALIRDRPGVSRLELETIAKRQITHDLEVIDSLAVGGTELNRSLSESGLGGYEENTVYSVITLKIASFSIEPAKMSFEEKMGYATEFSNTLCLAEEIGKLFRAAGMAATSRSRKRQTDSIELNDILIAIPSYPPDMNEHLDTSNSPYGIKPAIGAAAFLLEKGFINETDFCKSFNNNLLLPPKQIKLNPDSQGTTHTDLVSPKFIWEKKLDDAIETLPKESREILEEAFAKRALNSKSR